MTEWTKAKILIGVIIAIMVLLISFNSVDPLYVTNETVIAEVTQSTQILPRYRESYNRTVVKFKNGELHTFEIPLNYKIKSGNKVTVLILKRRITGFRAYKIKY